MNIGYIYIMINPSYPNLVKIGKTSRSPEERAAELSQTSGVPTPFYVAYEELVKDYGRVETFRRIRFSAREPGA